MAELLEQYTSMIETALERAIPNGDSRFKRVLDAMRYSLLAGGKRIRPKLVLTFCELCGGDAEKAIPFACAIEMIHTYSLIHDDLPCMDDDDWRRGRPSCHKAYGEDVALLAGDALQSEAFRVLASADLPSDRVQAAVSTLATLCGSIGMVGGQMIDIDAVRQPLSESELLQMYSLKTSCLLKASCCLGCIAAGRLDLCESASAYGEALGLAFQIRDDVLDVIGEAEKLGKPIGSDEKNGKPTLVALIGVDRANELVQRYSEEAKKALVPFESKAVDLLNFTDTLMKRDR